MPRAQSAHAIVNIGCLYKVNPDNVVKRARIVIQGLSSTFLRARATEAFLIGKHLFNNETLQGALQVLDGEMVVEENPPEPSVAYRRFVAKALLYKVYNVKFFLYSNISYKLVYSCLVLSSKKCYWVL